jgi:hypothetical protein
MQNVTQAAFTATLGTVAASGPAGVGNATNATITYSPAGFNPTYATWEIAAITNTINATLTVPTNYPLDHPIFQVDNYNTNQLPASIAVGAGLTNAGVNYFASLDAGGHHLWITVNRVVTNALNLVIRFSASPSQPAPVISSFSPTSGLVGATVTITGQNLTNATTLTFNGVGVSSFTIVSATEITTTVPAGATTGPVAVTTPGGTIASTGNFTVTTPAPTLTSFSPTSGPVGTSVTITGANLTGATAVSFNGIAAATFTVNSATQITATVPTGATTGELSLTTPGGTVHSTTTFVIQSSANLPVYTDALLNGFADYSWATNVNDYNPSPVYSGAYSISVTGSAYTALSLYHADFSTAPYASLSFWINGGAAGASGLQVMGVTNVSTTLAYASIYNLPALAPNTWTQFNLPLSALGVANITNCQGFWFWPTLAGATTFYVDSVQLNVSTPPALTLRTLAKPSAALVVQLTGLTGQSYWLQTSTNLLNWTSVSTNQLVTTSLSLTNFVNPALSREYWRAVLP